MDKSRGELVLIYFLATMMAFSPFVAFGVANEKPQLAATVGELLNPDTWFRALRENITIPTSGNREVRIPTPEQALRDASPKLKEVNRDVREEIGIDFAKFISWFARALQVFFQIIVNILEQVATAMRS